MKILLIIGANFHGERTQGECVIRANGPYTKFPHALESMISLIYTIRHSKNGDLLDCVSCLVNVMTLPDIYSWLYFNKL